MVVQVSESGSAWRVALRQRVAGPLEIWVPAGILGAMVIACFLVPMLVDIPGPNAGSLGDAQMPPLSSGHLLGTDALGNDLLSRSLYGGRVSLVVGVAAVSLGLAIGGSIGTIAGYIGGVVETMFMRLLDMFLAFPPLVLALAVATYLGPNERDVIFAIGFFTVPAYGRLARASTLRLREGGVVRGAKVAGQKDRWIVIRHVVPNVVPGLITYGLLTTGVAMIIESSLDFLGVGVRPPQPSWGSMIASGVPYLNNAWWMVVVPSAFLFVTVICLNVLGDALRARWEVS